MILTKITKKSLSAMAWCIGRSKDSNENDENNEDNDCDKI